MCTYKLDFTFRPLPPPHILPYPPLNIAKLFPHLSYCNRHPWSDIQSLMCQNASVPNSLGRKLPCSAPLEVGGAGQEATLELFFFFSEISLESDLSAACLCRRGLMPEEERNMAGRRLWFFFCSEFSISGFKFHFYVNQGKKKRKLVLLVGLLPSGH